MSDQCRKLNEALLKEIDESYVSPAALAAVKECQEAFQAMSAVGKTAPMSPYKKEADFQRDVDRFLESRGFVRLTPGVAERMAGVEIPGWYGHMVHAPGNPFMPDTFVFAHKKPPFLCELKVRNKFGMGQREMIAAGWWELAWSMDDFCKAFQRWVEI